MRSVVVAIAAALLFSTIAASASDAGRLVGRWRLVEQHYERGQQNLAEYAEAHQIEVLEDIEGVRVRTWSGTDPRRAVSWPAVLVDGRAIDIVASDRSVDVPRGILRAEYRVEPGVEGGQTIDVVEEYRLDAEQDVLVGSITFRMSRDGAPRGGYVLHRRYERMP